MLPSRRALRPAFRALLALALLAGCSDGTPTDEDPDDPDPPEELVRGFSLSPEGFPADFSGLGAFFDEVESLGRGTVMFNGLWRDDPAGNGTSGTVPAGATLVASEAGGHDYVPVSVFGWRSGETLFLRMPDDPTNDWTNESARDAFIDMVTTYAARWEPRYVFLGNETDFYLEQEPGSYSAWVDAYGEMYAAIKDVSPNTLVGTVFNVEHMTGRGALVGWSQPFTGALTSHDRSILDVVGLTVYPYLNHERPEDVPDDYLAGVFGLVGSTPVVITETGWPAGSPGGEVPWEPGEDEQVAYAAKLAGMIEGRDVPLVNWLFLYPPSGITDPEILRTFATVSVRDGGGAKRPVYDVWADFR